MDLWGIKREEDLVGIRDSGWKISMGQALQVRQR
jgi:hypothetical protein